MNIKPQQKPKNIAIFGATGTIGDSALHIVRSYPDMFRASILTANENWQKLAKLAHEFQPDMVIIANGEYYAQLRQALPPQIEVRAGYDELVQASAIKCDAHISAIVGFAALKPTLQSVRAGNKIIIANKECLVAAGSLLMSEAKTHNVEIIPVDSEHNGLFQLWRLTENNPPASVTLTASGGALRNYELSALKDATPAQAIAHPNWSMGEKISVDSATLMNKGLELIEAQHLFALKPEQLRVIIHPQSIIHCLVNFPDGSSLAQLSLPDMRIPLSYGMHHPARLALDLPQLNLAQISQLNFAEVDFVRYPCLNLAYSAMEAGGAAPIALNAANEIAVEAFLRGQVSFTDIAAIVEQTLSAAQNSFPTTLDEIIEINHIVRSNATQLVKQWI